MPGSDRIGILFVCMGNICRSPLAEGIFLREINRRGIAARFAVDSCGTVDWNAGSPPDPRVIEVAARHDVVLPGRARQIRRDDFDDFDHLICLDSEVLESLCELGAPEGKLSLLLDADPDATDRDVPDPYHRAPEEFEEVHRLIESGVLALLDRRLGPRA